MPACGGDICSAIFLPQRVLLGSFEIEKPINHIAIRGNDPLWGSEVLSGQYVEYKKLKKMRSMNLLWNKKINICMLYAYLQG